MFIGAGPDDEIDQIERIEDVIDRWVSHEMAPWRNVVRPQHFVTEKVWDMVERHSSLCLIQIEDGVAYLNADLIKIRPNLNDPMDLIGIRAAAYVSHLNDALSIYGVDGSGLLPVFLDDIFPVFVEEPIFCFQKYRGSRSILLPDIDFIHRDYYAGKEDELIDSVAFENKRDAAIFVGSTTGSVPLTGPHVTGLKNNRLRAAVRFRDNDRIKFHLPQIVQCDCPDTEALVRALDVGGQTATWQEQLGFRHLLSMDGNGATCSRVVLALKSNSILWNIIRHINSIISEGWMRGDITYQSLMMKILNTS